MKLRGFTLIELLIVVAIIAILATSTVQNFLEAQVRAKVSASKADIKALALALESYRVDYDSYPWYPYEEQNLAVEGANNPHCGFTPPTITIPFAYLILLPTDKFEYGKNICQDNPTQCNPLNLYNDTDHKQYANPMCLKKADRTIGKVRTDITWVIVGKGPDLAPTCNEDWLLHGNMPEYFTELSGSWGDIVCYGPDAQFDRTKSYSLLKTIIGINTLIKATNR